MLIFVNDLIGERIELNVKTDETITNVKEKIFDRLGIPTDQQRLIYIGKRLDEFYGRRKEPNRLTEWQIKEGSTLHLIQGLGWAGDAKLVESTTDASAIRSQQYWEEKAKRYDFDEDMHIVDPQSHFHMLRQLKRDVVQRSEYTKTSGSYSISSLFDVKWGSQSLEQVINATREIPRWLKDQIIEMVPVWQVRFTSFADEGPIFEEWKPKYHGNHKSISKTLADIEGRHLMRCRSSLKYSGNY